MLSDTPYEPPQADPETPFEDSTPVSDVLVEHLRKTRPWVKFCSIVGIVMSFFLLIIALLTLLYTPQIIAETQVYLLSGFYFTLAALFVIPSIKLSHYEKAITRLLITKSGEDIEIAIAHQMIFWKQVALMIFLIFIIYLITVTFSTITLIQQ